MANEILTKVEEEARSAISKLLDANPDLRPLCIRIAFHDAIKYNPTTKADGPNGSIRMLEEYKEMKEAVDKLDDLKAKMDRTRQKYLSYADLYQLAGIVAVEKAGGPSKIKFKLGRMDSCRPIDSSKIPIITKDSTSTHVKDTFHRIGFTDKEIVALFSAYYYWLNYTSSTQPPFDSSYYQKLLEEEKASKSKVSSTSSAPNTSSSMLEKQLSKSPTTTTLQYWNCLLSDDSFRNHVESFAKVENEFQKVYVDAHEKLSKLGFEYFPQPIPMEVEYHDIKHGIAFAMAMTILFGFVGFFYEVMRP